MQTRIYLPLDLDALERLQADGALGPAPLTAYAVTAGLRRGHPGEDEEDLEYVAFVDAARSAPAVRVVAAADVDEQQVSDRPEGAPRGSGGSVASAVQVTAEVPRRRVVSLHVAEATPTGGRPEEGTDAGGIPGLSWYDATELDVVLDLLRPTPG